MSETRSNRLVGGAETCSIQFPNLILLLREVIFLPHAHACEVKKKKKKKYWLCCPCAPQGRGHAVLLHSHFLCPSSTAFVEPRLRGSARSVNNTYVTGAQKAALKNPEAPLNIQIKTTLLKPVSLTTFMPVSYLESADRHLTWHNLSC